MKWAGKIGLSDGMRSITFKGTAEEIDRLTGALELGTHWLKKGDDGEIAFESAFLPVPPPVEDPAICDQWPVRRPDQQMTLLEYKDLQRNPSTKEWNLSNRSIYIWSVCGYDGKKVYKDRVAILESWGFECMRSRRGVEGKFWECWYLPGMWAAKGEFKGTSVKDVVFMIHNRITPGNIEFGGERWGLSID